MAKVTQIHPNGTECVVDLTNRRADGWVIIPPCGETIDREAHSSNQ